MLSQLHFNKRERTKKKNGVIRDLPIFPNVKVLSHSHNSTIRTSWHSKKFKSFLGGWQCSWRIRMKDWRPDQGWALDGRWKICSGSWSPPPGGKYHRKYFYLWQPDVVVAHYYTFTRDGNPNLHQNPFYNNLLIFFGGLVL